MQRTFPFRNIKTETTFLHVSVDKDKNEQL